MYRCSVWGCCSKLKPIDCIVYDAPNEHFFESLCLKTIKEVVDKDIKMLIYKSLNGLAPRYLQTILLEEAKGRKES